MDPSDFGEGLTKLGDTYVPLLRTTAIHSALPVLSLPKREAVLCAACSGVGRGGALAAQCLLRVHKHEVSE